MPLLRFLPTAVCALLMAAHVMRMGFGPVAIAVAALSPLLLLVRSAWVPWAARLLLLAGAVEWLRTAGAYAAERRALGAPSARLWVILGSVAAFHLVAAALLRGGRVSAWFGGRAAGAEPTG